MLNLLYFLKFLQIFHKQSKYGSGSDRITAPDPEASCQKALLWIQIRIHRIRIWIHNLAFWHEKPSPFSQPPLRGWVSSLGPTKNSHGIR
jgi:hypothetical protein